MEQKKKSKSENPIYAITVLSNGYMGVGILTQRTIGYGNSLKESKSYVEKNRSDIHECLYSHVVIEEIRSGIHPEVTKEYWYEWDRKKKKYKPCDKPKKLIGIVNFGIG